MAQSLYIFDLPLIESGRLYKPSSLAREILNLEPTPEGTLRSVRGPAAYEIHSKVSLGQIYGICHSSSLGGANDLLIVRAGSVLYRHTGWNRTWTPIKSNLNSEDRQRYPDSFVEIGGKVIWSNGVDRPRVIDSSQYYGALDYPLGFERAPSILTVYGPNQSDTDAQAADADYPLNWFGYSHQGRIGTPGDVSQGEDGCVASGSWLYAACLEDINGNLSPMSPVSNSVSVVTQSAGYETIFAGAYKRVNQVDDMTRAFMVTSGSAGPEHTAYLRIYRTPDTKHFATEFYLLARLPGNHPVRFPDNVPDGTLMAGVKAARVVAVPNYSVACEYQGRLVVFVGGMIRFSQPGFPGTFYEDDYIVPDASGAEGSGLISMGGQVLAFTPRSTYLVNIDAEGIRSVPLSKTIGCVAPASIVGLDDGSIIWLGRDGFYIFANGAIRRVSDAITSTVVKLNPSRVGRASAIFDPMTSEYKCSVATASSQTNNLMLCYDTQRLGWRNQLLGIHMSAMCVTNDDRRYPVAGGFNADTDEWDVFVLGHESRTFTPPTKKFLYKSGDIRLGDMTGLQRFKVTKILVGFIESDANAQMTVRYYKDGRNDSPVSTTMKLVENDFSDSWSYGGAVVGTTVFRDPKVCWSRVDVDITNVSSFRFELELSDTNHVTIHGIAVVGENMDVNGSRVTAHQWSTPGGS